MILVVIIFLLIVFVVLSTCRREFIQIAHAGGLYRGQLYTNSLEAIDYNRNMGFNYFEIDILYIDNDIRVSHDEQKKGPYPQFSEIVEYVKKNRIYIILDIKNEYSRVLSRIGDGLDGCWKYFIPQVYCMLDMIEVGKYKFDKVLIANWKFSPSFGELEEMIGYARSKKIRIVGTSLWSNFKMNKNDKWIKYYEFYEKKKIPIFIHGSINNKEVVEYAKMKKYNIFSQTSFN